MAVLDVSMAETSFIISSIELNMSASSSSGDTDKMDDSTVMYDRFYSEKSGAKKGILHKCDFPKCEKTAVYFSGFMWLCIDHYKKKRKI